MVLDPTGSAEGRPALVQLCVSIFLLGVRVA